MAVPTFRFVELMEDAGLSDRRFWRDVEASDRLGSAEHAGAYLRELCRMKSLEDTGPDLDQASEALRQRRERALLTSVQARGYRVGDPSGTEAA